MLRAMLFIDFENFEAARINYYKDDLKAFVPKVDFTKLPKEIVSAYLSNHALVNTFLFAPKPDEFLMKDIKRANSFKWISGLNNIDFFSVVEGRHVSRLAEGYSEKKIENKASYYVVEKGTDVNLATHVLMKGMNNSYDTAIILSGDTDYIPVMDALKMIGKSVVVIGVSGQNLMRFRSHSDAQFLLDDSFFQKCIR